MNKLIVSPSPHQLGTNSVSKLMYGVIIAMLPALFVSIFYFGLGAIVVTLTSVLSCLIFEYVFTRFLLKKEPTLKDGSAIITGMLLAFNLPSNLPIWIIIIGALVAIGVGKVSFGGLGNNIFNPALVGRVFLLISFPVQMTNWPKPVALTTGFSAYTDVTSGATPLGLLKEGLRNKESLDSIMSHIEMPTDYLQLFLGNMSGSIGEISAAALLIGLVYMLMKKIITWHIPVAVLGSASILSGIMWLADSNLYADPVFHLLTGGMLLGAIFMATDYVSSPMSTTGMLIFGAGIGLLTIVIRLFGAFPEGMSFAILIMNAIVPILNKYFKPKRFGEKLKTV